MDYENHYLEFVIEEESYWAALHAVSKVIRCVQLINYPGDNDNLVGLVNINGQIVPVVNIRKLLGLSSRDMELNDRIIVLESGLYRIAFMADRIETVIHLPVDKKYEAEQIFPGTEHYIQSIGRFNDKPIKICNVDALLTIHGSTGMENIPKREPHKK